MSEQLFPFGRPVLPRPPSTAGARPAYILGAYPSGLHVRWIPPDVPGTQLKPVRALIVDNEPTPFWNGKDAKVHFDRWRENVCWREEWGQVSVAAPGANGPSGQWVDDHILSPLGLTRDGSVISDCLDAARLNRSQANAVEGRYKPVAEHMGLSDCTLRPVPRGEAGIVREAKEGHIERLRRELDECHPVVVVTLGNAALRVMSAIAGDDEDDHPLRIDDYGRARKLRLGNRNVEWLPLVHPRSGERTPRWADAHADWEATRHR